MNAQTSASNYDGVGKMGTRITLPLQIAEKLNKTLFQTLNNRQFRIVILERGKTHEASLAKSQLTAWSGFLDWSTGKQNPSWGYYAFELRRLKLRIWLEVAEYQDKTVSVSTDSRLQRPAGYSSGVFSSVLVNTRCQGKNHKQRGKSHQEMEIVLVLNNHSGKIS